MSEKLDTESKVLVPELKDTWNHRDTSSEVLKSLIEGRINRLNRRFGGIALSELNDINA